MIDGRHLVRDENVVWRDIADEVIIVEKDYTTIRVLNKTASFIWTLADGTRCVDDITSEICNKYDVTPEQARSHTEEFCNQLLETGLIKLVDSK